jgi:phage tail sheath protein FI
MPEYLAPGVYVEEVEIGAKPIEGVSTSTAGFLGYAERGPLNKPTLVTSFSEFEMIFGGYLPASKNGTDLGKIRWLAYGVAGFFENGGKRAFVTRVADESSAQSASGFLPKVSDDSPQSLAEAASPGETGLVLTGTVGFTADDSLLLKDGANSEYLTYSGKPKRVTLSGTLAGPHYAGAGIMKGVKSATSVTIGAAAAAGASSFTLSDVTGIGENDYLLIEDSDAGSGNEVVAVSKVEDPTVTIKGTLRFAHAVGKDVFKLTTSKETTLIRNVDAGASELIADMGTTLQGGEFLVIGGEYIEIASRGPADEVAQVTPALKYAHQAGRELITLESAVEVEASSEGSWGNDIKVAIKPSSLSSTEVTADISNSKRLDLETITGIEPGSVLRLPESSSPRYVTVEETHKTAAETFVTVDQAVSLTAGDPVETDEFDLYITDGTNEEVFKHLSLVEDHSRYITRIVTEKSSNLIRIVEVVALGSAMALPTSDDLPGWFLTGGSDGFPADDSEINTIFEGADSTEPANRTGLYTFKNVDEINIAAIPGITTRYLQQKLISHCEVDTKDRFAVLDSQATADLDEIKKQRNMFDSSYASLYYPWLHAFDPLAKQYTNVPPSGYMCGVFARTDVERGVHKAPANEKINGVVNTERLNGKFRIVNKGTQEILNPLGVNCTRSFPGRGIRVWGARTISSNTLWKYINVRRLFLFLEESIENGTQWVVFEPNDEKLWARVKQTIGQFLTKVWKDGALMGSTPEEAFFVKCDRTTMTQSDIDNGRLIVMIGVAPVKPAEFVIFRIAQWQGGSAVTE